MSIIFLETEYSIIPQQLLYLWVSANKLTYGIWFMVADCISWNSLAMICDDYLNLNLPHFIPNSYNDSRTESISYVMNDITIWSKPHKKEELENIHLDSGLQVFPQIRATKGTLQQFM